MATRFRAIFPDIRSQSWTVTIDDPDYVGAVVEVDCIGGFKLRHQGEGKGMYNYIMGSSLSFGIAVSATTRAALETFQVDLIDIPEGRFRLRSSGGRTYIG